MVSLYIRALVKSVLACLLFLCFTVVFSSRRACAQDLSVGAVLNALEAATADIRSYDIYFALTNRFLIHTKRVYTKEPGKGVSSEIVSEERRSGESIKEQSILYRQLFASPDRWRREKLIPDTGELIQIKTFDGETTWTLDMNSKSGSIRGSLSPLIPSEGNYLCYFRDDPSRRRLADILTNAPMTQASRDAEHPAWIVVDTTPVKGPRAVANTGYRVTLDSEHGMLPVVIDDYLIDEAGKEWLRRRKTISKFQEVSDGVWVPVAGKGTVYVRKGALKGKPKVETLWEVQSGSRWNIDLDDETFRIDYPAGASLLDRLRKVTFLTGESSPGANIDELLRNAEDIVPLQPGSLPLIPVMGNRNKIARMVIAANIAALLAIITALGIRRYRRRAVQ